MEPWLWPGLWVMYEIELPGNEIWTEAFPQLPQFLFSVKSTFDSTEQTDTLTKNTFNSFEIIFPIY